MNEIYYQILELLATPVLTYSFYILLALTAITGSICLAVVLIGIKQEGVKTPISLILFSLLFFPLIATFNYTSDLTLPPNSCFMKLVQNPLHGMFIDTNVLRAEAYLYKTQQALILARKYKAKNTPMLEMQEKAIKADLELVSKYTGKANEYPKMMEFMVIAENEFGNTLISEDSEIFSNEKYMISSNRFIRTNCSSKIVQIIDANQKVGVTQGIQK